MIRLRFALCAAALALAAPAAAAIRDRVVLPADVAPAEYRIEITPDPAAPTFSATVEIDVDVLRATSRIVLNSAELVIERVTLSGEARPAAVSYDPEKQTAAFSFNRVLHPGRRTLRIAYHGRIYDQAEGLFALKYATPQGEARALFTQFESADARRFVPCWDEPARKAVFRLGATLPAELMPIGNMPVEAVEAVAGGPVPMQHVRFAPTPKMSSYLLYFGAGDFERVHREVDGVDVGVVVKRGDTSSAAYALDAAASILPFYDEYFGVRYPLPKMDMIAAPGESVSFGAMENWGALLYFEQNLLVDPRLATEQNRQDIFLTIAHEMAHQWFGDLVTMDWWDDLWLNEGFATWMQTKAAEHVHPEWKPWLQLLRRKNDAMGSDAREGTHPVILPVRDVLRSAGIFDDITYNKGAQVIRTVESSVGEDAFRDGVRRYMQRHAYGNTVSDDFWRALDEDAAHPVARIAHDLTQQPGVPLLREMSTTCLDGHTRVVLSQEEFRLARDPSPSRRWHLPVAAATLEGAPGRSVFWGPEPQALRLAGCGPVLLNAGQAAYYRVRYDAANLHALAAAFAALAPDDQLGLLQDTFALALRGDFTMATLADMMRRVPADGDPVVALALVEQLRDLDRIADGQAGQPALRRFARGLLAPVAARVGWEPVAGESANDAKLREAVLQALGDMNDAAVVAEARRRFEHFLADPSGVEAGERRIVLHVVATNADAAAWDTLHGLAQRARTHLERLELYRLLGAADDTALTARALELALSGEPPATTPAIMFKSAAQRHPALAFEFLSQHWEQVEPLLGQGSAGSVVPKMLLEASDASLLPGLEAFGLAHVPLDARLALDKTEANIRYRARVREARLPELERGLAVTRR
jgi:aminopeptidase N